MGESPRLIGGSDSFSRNKYFTAFVLIKTEGDVEEIIKKLRGDGVIEAYPLAGEYQIIARVEAQTEKSMESILKHKIRDLDSVKGTITLNVHEPSHIPSRDLESRIERIIGETGVVKPKYGGYEVQVVNEAVFPWSALFNVLLESSMEVWVTRKDGMIVISSKPPSF
ncbi:MAG: Lrp/AsnC ligand binding domain-containing protein [Candidatus Bathyarchaeia archaeon]